MSIRNNQELIREQRHNQLIERFKSGKGYWTVLRNHNGYECKKKKNFFLLFLQGFMTSLLSGKCNE